MIVDNIKDILETETKQLIENLENQIQELNQKVYNLENDYYDSQSTNAKLVLELEDAKKNLNNIESVKNILNVNDRNLLDVLKVFGFISIDNTINGMYDPPAWFVALVKFYNEKERLFKVLDILKIDYPLYAKSIKMPYDYNEKELEILFKNMFNLYVCNGCMTESNLGFWYRENAPYSFDVKKCLEHNYSEIPWQFILKNPLLLTDKFFTMILNSIKKNESNSHMFYELHLYQDLSVKHCTELAKLLMQKKGEIYTNQRVFLERNFPKIKDDEALEIMFQRATDSTYGTLSWVNFPPAYQVRFIKKINGYQKQIEHVFNSKLNEEEKKKLIVELSNNDIA